MRTLRGRQLYRKDVSNATFTGHIFNFQAFFAQKKILFTNPPKFKSENPQKNSTRKISKN